MNITTKYSLGETVFAIRRDFVSRIVKCKACENTGSIKIDGESFECPKCKGASKHHQSAGLKTFVYESGKIGQVRFETTDGAYKEQRRNYDLELGVEPPETEIKYMIDCTGIGSGTLWDEEDLFPSREDAQAFCDAKNATLLKDEA